MRFKTFDHIKLESHFQGDEEILLDMIDVLEEAQEGLLSSIRDAVKTKDSNELRIRAHTFKGIMSNFYAMEAREVSLKIEEAAKSFELDNAHELVLELEGKMGVLIVELKDFKSSLKKV